MDNSLACTHTHAPPTASTAAGVHAHYTWPASSQAGAPYPPSTTHHRLARTHRRAPSTHHRHSCKRPRLPRMASLVANRPTGPPTTCRQLSRKHVHTPPTAGLLVHTRRSPLAQLQTPTPLLASRPAHHQLTHSHAHTLPAASLLARMRAPVPHTHAPTVHDQF